MTSTTVFTASAAKEAKIRSSATPSLGLGAGILLIVASAAFWIVSLVLFHNLMDRLLR